MRTLVAIAIIWPEINKAALQIKKLKLLYFTFTFRSLLFVRRIRRIRRLIITLSHWGHDLTTVPNREINTDTSICSSSWDECMQVVKTQCLYYNNMIVAQRARDGTMFSVPTELTVTSPFSLLSSATIQPYLSSISSSIKNKIKRRMEKMFISLWPARLSGYMHVWTEYSTLLLTKRKLNVLLIFVYF